VGLPTVGVVSKLGCLALVIAKYREEVRMLDDVLSTQARLGDSFCGILINRVPEDASDFVKKIAIPFLENKKIKVFGVLPEVRGLSALTVGELINLLEAEVLTKYQRLEALVENLTVGAMTAEAALSRFRRSSNKAVITGGDRTDIQLAALETSTTCLILTGNLRPSPLVIKQAEEFGISVLLVRTNTMETIEQIEKFFGKTRLGQTAKLKQFQSLLDTHLDKDRLYQSLGLKS
jgi:BioD-like phosphotransacetylase family protein